MLTTFPQYNFEQESPEILIKNLLHYYGPNMGNSKIMHCGIVAQNAVQDSACSRINIKYMHYHYSDRYHLLSINSLRGQFNQVKQTVSATFLSSGLSAQTPNRGTYVAPLTPT